MRYNQRHARARILKALANEIIAAIERIRHGNWLVGLEAEAVRFGQTVQAIRCIDNLFYDRTCELHDRHEEEYV